MISQSRLKIMLSADDMQKYSLGTELDYSDSVTRRAFRSILKEAKEKTGFNAETEKIYVQFYPSKKGGCELYITKINDECEYSEYIKDDVIKNPLRRTPEHSSGFIPPQKRLPNERKRAFVFSSSDHLVAVCKRLSYIKWRGKSRAYKDDGGNFHLLLCDKSIAPISALDRLSFITEYGRAENYSETEIYLSEYGKAICDESAVEKLGQL